MMHESMQTALSIVREAKGLSQSLKESLKKHEPWDREIEFQRSNLRRQYLQLIFVHPYAKESKDADHSLWMTTSYLNITAYKQRITAADAVAHQSGSDSNVPGRHNHHGKPAGVVEHRKLVHRFRQFLAEEEKFWTSLVVRVVHVFQLDEARPVLTALGIPTSDLAGLEGSSGSIGRRSVFPAEDATPAPSPAKKEQKLIMLSKALVCLGDIARYREHYNESGGRPRAGKDFHDDAKPATRGRGGRRGVIEQPLRPRNYSKAQECYERARLLVPDVGNACHQLAILASYQQDHFASVLHYYRAMCVKHPYDTAAANLDSTLSRNLEGYRMTLAKLEAATKDASQPQKVRVDRFKKSLVALHGLWRLDPTDADARLPGHAASVMMTFSSLVSERVLPTDIIWKTLVLALGALWRFRVLRDPNPKRNTRRESVTVEGHILMHVLGVFGTLLRVGSIQLTDASITTEPLAQAGNGELQTDLAQNITAVFRRMLPALRIGSKWLRLHFEYIGDATSRLSGEMNLALPAATDEFWGSYMTFSTLLGKLFPIEKLPKMIAPLEEDVDVSGFAPLKRAMFGPNANPLNGLEPGQSQVHPNEEQLMRIADLLQDALTICELEDSPLLFANGRYLRRPEGRPFVVSTNSPEIITATLVPLQIQDYANEAKRHEIQENFREEVYSELDDDNATVSTKTEDDPVSLAMQAQLGSDDDDDEMDEQILYPKQKVTPPAASASSSNSFSTPSVHAKPLSPLKPVTAEDLVNEMMRPRGSSSVDPALPRVATTGTQLPPPLLFGSGSPSAPTSIWSATTLDSAALSANNLRVTGFPGSHARGTPPSVQTLGLRQEQAAQMTPLTPTRGGYSHQRQSSQPLASPTLPGSWANQSSSPLGLPQTHPQQTPTMSPPSEPVALHPPVVGTRSHYQTPVSYGQLQSTQHPTRVGLQFSRLDAPSKPLLSNYRPPPSHSTWSYSGTESPEGIVAPLGPYSVPLSYVQSRLQHRPQTPRPGAWAPS